MDGKYRSRRDHKHKNKNKDERWLRKKDGCDRKARAMVKASDVDSISAYSSSSSSSSENEGDRCKNKKVSKNLSRLSCFVGDGFCDMAYRFGSKKSHQSHPDSNPRMRYVMSFSSCMKRTSILASFLIIIMTFLERQRQ
jgi:hypothetical protein